MKEILCGSVGAICGPNVESEGNIENELVDQGRTTSACPVLTPSGNVGGSGCEVSSHEHDEVDRILREELGGSRVTSTPVKSLCPSYGKRRSTSL